MPTYFQTSLLPMFSQLPLQFQTTTTTLLLSFMLNKSYCCLTNVIKNAALKAYLFNNFFTPFCQKLKQRLLFRKFFFYNFFL